MRSRKYHDPLTAEFPPELIAELDKAIGESDDVTEAISIGKSSSYSANGKTDNLVVQAATPDSGFGRLFTKRSRLGSGN